MQGTEEELYTVRCEGRWDFRKRGENDVQTASQAASIEVGVPCFYHATIREPDCPSGDSALRAPLYTRRACLTTKDRPHFSSI
mmetsp:Transcript_3359/g.4924  ORF Transcript_3359/g.4924 Transcript_3359/m.4924 type:complete len:83 (+) Transcript_3359:310-558(+)